MKSILFIQHGDYAEAYRRFENGGDETFRDQRRSVDHTHALARTARVTVLALKGVEGRADITRNLTALTTRNRQLSRTDAMAIMAECAATHVILCTPMAGAVSAAAHKGIALLPLFADQFTVTGWRSRLRLSRLSRALRQAPVVSCVANHSLNASLSLRDVLGIPADRIVPWDHMPIAPFGTPKPASPAGTARLLYASRLNVGKGLEDLFAACKTVRQRRDVRLTVVGHGDSEDWRNRAEAAGLGDQVDIRGPVANAEVRHLMTGHDLIVVPSRADYPEGLPNVLLEGLCSHTPVIASDHPAFGDRLDPGACAIFRAGDPADLARQIDTVLGDSDRYAALSRRGPALGAALLFGINREDLIDLFLDDPTNLSRWVQVHSLDAQLKRPSSLKGGSSHG